MARTADALVADASVAVNWHLEDEERAREAAELLIRFSRGEGLLLAPEPIRYEVPSAIAVATSGRRPQLTYEQGQEAIEEFLALELTPVGDDALILAAYPLVRQHAIALYGAPYLALAQRSGCALVTTDRQLDQRIGQLPDVWRIAD